MIDDHHLFARKAADVFMEVAVNDVNEMKEQRKVSTDRGLIPIFKEQRRKYGAICREVNKVRDGLLSITDFDEVIKEIHPSIYGWYVVNVIA